MKNNSNNIEEELYLTSVKFSPDGKILPIWDALGHLIIYDLKIFEELMSIPVHSGDINSIDIITIFIWMNHFDQRKELIISSLFLIFQKAFLKTIKYFIKNEIISHKFYFLHR